MKRNKISNAYTAVPFLNITRILDLYWWANCHTNVCADLKRGTNFTTLRPLVFEMYIPACVMKKMSYYKTQNHEMIICRKCSPRNVGWNNLFYIFQSFTIYTDTSDECSNLFLLDVELKIRIQRNVIYTAHGINNNELLDNVNHWLMVVYAATLSWSHWLWYCLGYHYFSHH